MTAARRAAWWLLIATLALLPFESALPQFPLGVLTLTTLEAFWLGAVAVWLASLVLARRRPRVPAAVFVALGLMLVIYVASALLAGEYRRDALIFVGRSVTGWLLLLAVADQISDRAALRGALRAIVAGATVSALIGLPLYLMPSVADQLGVPLFVAAGAPRLQGTFDYPNIAAMYWEATGFLAAALIYLETSRRAKWLAGIALAIIVTAAILTLSRGAIVGAAGAMVVIAGLALWTQRRRLAASTVAAAAGLVVIALLVEVTVAPIARLFSDAESGLYGATYDAPAAVDVAGETTTVPVTVTNTGSLTWTATGTSAVVLGYHWLDPATGEVVGDGASTFPLGSVAPGSSATVEVSIDPADALSGREIAWDARQGASWFSDEGVPSYTTVIGAPTGSASQGGQQVTLNTDIGSVDRAKLWAAAVQMIQQQPILGVGPGTYRLRSAPYLGLRTADEHTHANETYLELGAETGIAGLLAILALVAVCAAGLLRALLRAPLSVKGDWLVMAGVVGALVAYLVHGVVDYFLAFNPTGGLWWVVLGLCVALPATLAASAEPLR